MGTHDSVIVALELDRVFVLCYLLVTHHRWSNEDGDRGSHLYS
ncbi:hypothetical protein [Trichocoleus sp. FACHB-262]|nr:hypothetical protein [Trichocoleus sp. FACHB-262]